jgi:tetratricopeptide (TPR) repeat protein
LNLGTIYADRKGDFDAAIAEYDRILIASDEDLSKVKLWRDPVRPYFDLRGTVRADRARALARKEDYAQALAEANGLVASYPDVGDAFVTRAHINSSLRKFDEAWRVYTGRANAIFNTFRAGKSPAALAAAEKAVAIKPDEPLVRMVYGRMLQINGRYEEAAKQYEAANGKYDPALDISLELMREPHPLESLADVYGKMGKPAVAAQTLSKYIDSIPEANRYYRHYQERGEYYEQAGIYAMAAEDFGEAAARAPAEYAEEIMAKRAMLLAKAGSTPSAGEELRSVLARGSLKPILKVQVFLRSQGYTDVTINGRYDGATKRALDACLLDKACAPGVGQAI